MKKGTPSTRNRRAQFIRLPKSRHPFIIVQHGLGLLPVQARLGNHVEECLPLADVPALREVGPENRLHHRILNPLFVSEPDEPVSVEGVRRPLDPVEGEMDAFNFSDRNHPGVEFL